MKWGNKVINTSLKKRKKRVYAFGALFSILCIFILGEALIPGNVSYLQSNFFAEIGAFFINLFNGPVIPHEIEATSISLTSDSSLIGEKQIVIGTTTLLQYDITYPEKEDGSDVYDTNIQFLRNDEDSSSSYNLLITKGTVNNTTHTMTSYIRIIANIVGSYSLKAEISDLSYIYNFDIIDKQKPTQFAITPPTAIKKNETYTLPFTYLDHFETAQIRDEDDPQGYLRRYYDQSLLTGMEVNSTCYVDDYGVIHAYQPGTYTCYYGDTSHQFDITVVDSSSLLPSSDTSIDITSVSGQCSINDYDHDTGLTLEAHLSGSILPTDTSVTWIVDDSLKAFVSPLENNQCLVQGYRNLGTLHVTAMLNTDHDITSTYQVTVSTIAPTDFTLNISGLDIDEEDHYSFGMGSSAYLSGTFLPNYTTNTAIEIVSTTDDEILEIIDNSSTTITVKAVKIGSTTLTIVSVAHPSITKTLTITVTAQTYINENNYNEYAMTTRKFLGHFLLFGVTTIIGFLFFKYSFETNSLKEDILPGLFSIGNGMLVVFISEFFQALVPSRGPSLTDIGIDTLGCLIFAILMMTLFLIIRLIRHQKKPIK